jgi:hypothetical protein
MPPELLRQTPVLEDALVAMGVTTWAMVEYEADDALGSAAQVAAADDRVEQVVICTPDKDLGQCVTGSRVVQLDRRKGETFDEAGIVAKFGVPPESIPDYLALVGDSADGFPAPGHRRRRARPPLRLRPEDISPHGRAVEVSLLRRGQAFRRIATLEQDARREGRRLEWRGPPAARWPRRSRYRPARAARRLAAGGTPPAEAAVKRPLAHRRHR